MKSNFTCLRNFFGALLLTVSFTSAFAQSGPSSNPSITNLTAAVVNHNIVINWNVTDDLAANYCEVQASRDGKNFSTVGIVLGADPKQNNNSFAFKQNLSKMKPGNVYYRVLSIVNGEKAVASNVIKPSI